MIINGTSFSVDDLHKLPPDLHGENICSITDQNSYGFFSKLHPFSNFYEVPFEFQGITYHSTEQMIQHLKATHFDDEETAEKILEADTLLECKKLAREIENYNNYGWNSIAKSMCESGIKCKFDQNSSLKLSLLKTKGKKLVECSVDEIWGTGVFINDHQALNCDRWINQGILGEILEEIRNDYISTDNTSQSRDISAMEDTTSVD